MGKQRVVFGNKPLSDENKVIAWCEQHPDAVASFQRSCEMLRRVTPTAEEASRSLAAANRSAGITLSK